MTERILTNDVIAIKVVILLTIDKTCAFQTHVVCVNTDSN